MDHSFKQYSIVAELFSYPTERFYQIVKDVQLYLNINYPQAGEILQPFTEFVEQANLSQLEEVYTRTFDVQAITTLDIGYVLFGDDYKRGKLLVHLNQEHREAQNDCQSELADHLPNVLRLLHKMKKADLRQELVQKIVAPALQKIISEFNPHQISRKREVYKKHHRTLIESSPHYGTIYQFPLQAVYSVLKTDFPISEISPITGSSEFTKAISTEIKIEPE